MFDLGLWDAQDSCALALNDKGQVLGTCNFSNEKHIFLWDDVNGLKIIEIPWKCDFLDLKSFKLNNNGQIAGRCGKIIFLWDPHLGFWEVDSYNLYEIIGFNNKGQINKGRR